MKVRRKTLVFEAEQYFHGHNPWGFPEVCIGKDEGGNERYQLTVPTLEGEVSAAEGDWIVTGILGERHPVREDIFPLTYEIVEEHGTGERPDGL